MTYLFYSNKSTNFKCKNLVKEKLRWNILVIKGCIQYAASFNHNLHWSEECRWLPYKVASAMKVIDLLSLQMVYINKRMLFIRHFGVYVVSSSRLPRTRVFGISVLVPWLPICPRCHKSIYQRCTFPSLTALFYNIDDNYYNR